MDSSPTSLKKRQPKQQLSKLENEVGISSQNGQRSKPKKENNNNKEVADKFFQSLVENDNILGPQNCEICGRDISKSIKIRCLECTSPVVYMCFECLRTGRTSP